MKLHTTRDKDTSVTLDISATVEELAKVKNKVLHMLAPSVKVAGFREGKVPMEVVEKNLDDATFQSEFLNEAIDRINSSSDTQENKVARLQALGLNVNDDMGKTTVTFGGIRRVVAATAN